MYAKVAGCVSVCVCEKSEETRMTSSISSEARRNQTSILIRGR